MGDDFYSLGWQAGYNGESCELPSHVVEAGEEACIAWLDGYDDGDEQLDRDEMAEIW